MSDLPKGATLRSPTRQSGGIASDNVFKSDGDIVGLLDRLERIKTFKRFQGFKASFLTALGDYLIRPGIGEAQKASDAFKATMTDMTKYVDRCNGMIAKGDLSNDKVTVKGRNSLNELVKHLTLATTETEALIPATKMHERNAGYTKFELGACLVRDSFSCFENMQYLHKSVKAMGESQLNQVADRQQLDAFEYYSKKFQNFCDIMADLGLLEFMLACQKFRNPPEHDEPDMIEITVTCPNGDEITLEVDIADTVGNIKQSIVDDCGIAPEDQILCFDGDPLDKDDKTLEECGIEDQSRLTVTPPTVPITVYNTMNGDEAIQLEIDPRKPMAVIKQLLREKTGLPIDNQRLFHHRDLTTNGQNGENDELEDDNKPASEYNIQGGSELDLEPRHMTVHVETPDGSKVSLQVKPKETTDDVKQQLEKVVGIPAAKQILQYADAELPDNDQTIKDLGIRDGDTLQLGKAKIPVTVRTTDGRTIEKMIDPDKDSLGDIKQQLESETGVPAKKLHLFYKDQEMEDDNQVLGDYGIVEAGTILNMVKFVYFVDEDTKAVGKVPLQKIGENVVQSASVSGSSRETIKERMLQLLG